MVKVNPDLAADRFGNMTSDPGVAFPLEVQDNVPVDGANRDLRNYSPFRIRTVLPEYLQNVEFLRGRINELSTRTAYNPNAGIAQPLPTRNAKTFNNANRTYDKSKTVARNRTSASSVLMPGLSDRSRAKINSDISDIEVFIENGRIRTANNNTYFSEPRFLDQVVIADIAVQALNIISQPALTLLINPETYSKSYNQIFNYNDRGRKGYIYKAWGEQQVKISFSGRIGAFIAGNSSGIVPNPTETDQISGVQFASKRDSASFQNLMSLFQMFRNNGYIFDRVNGTFAQHHVGHLAIEYDNFLYLGQMDNFNYSYTEESVNGGIAFDISFVVTQEIDLQQTTFAVAPLYNPNGNPEILRRGIVNNPSVDVPVDGTADTQAGDLASPISPSNSGTVNAGANNGSESISPNSGGFQ